MIVTERASRTNKELLATAIGQRLSTDSLNGLSTRADVDRQERLNILLSRAQEDGTRVKLYARKTSRGVLAKYQEVVGKLSAEDRISVGANFAVLIAQRNRDNGLLGALKRQ